MINYQHVHNKSIVPSASDHTGHLLIVRRNSCSIFDFLKSINTISQNRTHGDGKGFSNIIIQPKFFAQSE